MAPKRQRDVPDHADEKWWYPEHTAAKHEILKRYLGAWLTILGRGKQHPQLVLIDGFAGRGEYMEGEPGSPAIMFERACAVADKGTVERVWVRCAEPNATNFQQLKDVCDELSHPNVTMRPKQERFEDLAQSYIKWARQPSGMFRSRYRLAPSSTLRRGSSEGWARPVPSSETGPLCSGAFVTRPRGFEPLTSASGGRRSIH